MSDLRDEAEALAQALQLGVCDVAEVIAWADAQILREDLPSGALCDVSLARDRHPFDVAGLLREFPGTPARSNVSRLLVTLLDHRLKVAAGRPDRIAKALYEMAFAHEIEDPQLSEIAYWAWDALDLAEAGYIQEAWEEVVDKMSAALDRAAERAATTWSFGVNAREPSV
jgi:hypothetical protein